MMDTVEFLGVSFRSSTHIAYFLGTASVFINVGLIYAMWMLWGYYRAALGASLCLAGLEISVTAFAIYATAGGTLNGPLVSVDCIWYNELLARAHLLMAAGACAGILSRMSRHDE